jgi:hypothetical protein
VSAVSDVVDLFVTSVSPLATVLVEVAGVGLGLGVLVLGVQWGWRFVRSFVESAPLGGDDYEDAYWARQDRQDQERWG